MRPSSRHGLLAAAINLSVLIALALPHGRPPIGALLFLALAALFSYAEASAQEGEDSAGDMLGLSLLTGLATLLLFAVALVTAREASFVSMALGAGLVLAGIGLRRQAMRELGARFLSNVRSASSDSLKTDGLHGWLRHPSDLGLLLLGLGAVLMTASSWGFLAWALAFVPIVLLRLRAEEKCLRELYGEGYRRYALRVPALWPRLPLWAGSAER